MNRLEFNMFNTGSGLVWFSELPHVFRAARTITNGMRTLSFLAQAVPTSEHYEPHQQENPSSTPISVVF
jgi:hypothetical protein